MGVDNLRFFPIRPTTRMAVKKLAKIELVGEMNEDLSLKIISARAIARELRPYQGKTLIISIREYEEKRSDRQNRWYWITVQIVIAFRYDNEGEYYTDDEVHLYNMIHIADRKPVIREVFGRETIVMEGKTTSQMSVKDFMEFKEKLQKHYAEMGCVIPDPQQESFLTDYINGETKKLDFSISGGKSIRRF